MGTLNKQSRKKERNKPDCQIGYKTIVKKKPLMCNLQTQVQNPEKMKETESLALNRKMRDRNKLDRENKKQNGNILAWIKSQENQNSGKKTEKKEDGKELLSVSGLAERQKAIITGPPNEILVKHQLQMTRSDFRSLFDKNYLNDKIIDQYLLLIKQRSLESGG